jgi:steroid delta-isomerase-like uncharacterized protein
MERIAMAVTTTEENERIVRRTVEAFNEQNYDVFDEVFAEDAMDHGPAGETRGREGPREGLKMLFTAFPDLVITIDDLVANGDTVALRTTHRGTHEGEFMGIEPTGKQIEVGSSIFAQFEDGKVVERWVQYDTFGLMQQLGAVDAPGA